MVPENESENEMKGGDQDWKAVVGVYEENNDATNWGTPQYINLYIDLLDEKYVF